MAADRDHPRPARSATAGQRVIGIVGMHRSGTSSLAGTLQECGLYLGDVQTVNPHNRKGNRESLEIMHLHDDVLAANGGSWDRPPARVRWSEAHRERLGEIIASFAGSSLWGFKDPRTLLTVDGWLARLPRMEFAGSFRHPAATAASLQQRGRGDIGRWLDLWLAYNRKLLALAERHDLPLVEFHANDCEYRGQLRALIERLGLTVPPEGFSFFDPALRHEPDAVDQPLPPDVADCYASLQYLAIPPR